MRIPLLLFLLLFAFVLPPDTYAAPKQPPIVKLETSLGDIVLQLDEHKAPVTTANFLRYVKAGHYDGCIFHRVIRDFMIQGGGLEADMKEKPTRNPIRNEAKNGLLNKKYTIAMARTQDPHSATAQFFINTKNNAFLDFKEESDTGWGYAVFGKVIAGKQVVDKIERVATSSKGIHQDVPISPIIIKKAVIVKN
ncbi:MAG: peptidyl-prolyl cis-trans isomerase [Desulfovibrio sp.]|nr:peptidyl-prolyl cis-trans isomerase [Desulfovibrio sp.]